MKRAVSTLLILVLVFSLSTTAFAASGTWKQNSKGWWYEYSNGDFPAGEWESIGGKWYLFNNAGYMLTGWQKDGGKWYYLGGNGAMRTGWQKVGGKWYYLGNNGAMRTGWQKVSGKWYYLASSGVMQTGWVKVGSKWYYMDGSGVMQTGWIKLGGYWYYLNSNGAMQTDDLYDNDYLYFFNSSGKMVSKSEYFHNSDFDIDYNKLTITPTWAYYKNGTLVVECVVANGYPYTIYNIRVNDFTLSDASHKTLGTGSFGTLDISSLAPNNHVNMIFTYKKSNVYSFSADFSFLYWTYNYTVSH